MPSRNGSRRRAAAVLICTAACLLFGLPGVGTPWADEAAPADCPVYGPEYDYPVLDELREARKALLAERDSLRKLADERYEEEAEREEAEEQRLRLDWSGVETPEDPAAFASAFHFPPQPQHATGTCWAFATTSFFESEVHRLTGQQIRLSEMWTVYWEWVEKVRRFVREYGHSNLGPGSQLHATREIYRQYGAVPLEAYPGNRREDGRHDHTLMSREIHRYLHWVEENDYWFEERVVDYVRGILDEHLGIPPQLFDYNQRTYTPRVFLRSILELDMDDYFEICSTMRQPFGDWMRLDVHDNWRRREDYLNLPLERFYGVIRSAVQEGYTVCVGGDTSEPGVDGKQDAAVVPSFDIPRDCIDQASREFRIYNRTTTDDHGFHLVGYLQLDGGDWFLDKDSNRSSRLGEHAGYYFFQGDYIRLKMLSAMVHRDRLAGLLPAEDDADQD
ncbi:MAG: peptidase C1 [Candidatus Eisenbacteria bacterium]|nr:peptidase C1 [Candidatus Eisenbacteria bacterium]